MPLRSFPKPRKHPIKIILRLPTSMTEGQSEPAAAAEHAYEVAMAEHESQNGTRVGGVVGTDGAVDRDVVMTDEPTEPPRHLSPAILPGATLESHRTTIVPPSAAPSTSNNVPAGNLTPSRNTPSHSSNGAIPPSHTTATSNLHESNSRATSQHPEPVAAQQVTAASFPKVAAVHGAPTRQYLNQKVTVALLDGMKIIAKDQPKDPLRVLGEYLLQRSREIEGT